MYDLEYGQYPSRVHFALFTMGLTGLTETKTVNFFKSENE